MKRFRRPWICVPLLLVLLVQCLSGPETAYALIYPAGDMNGDGIINSVDAGLIGDVLLERNTAHSSALTADITQDGKVSLTDFHRAIQYDGDFDSDGIPDAAESQTTAFDPDTTGTDSNLNGIPDHEELDPDGDGFSDAVEGLRTDDTNPSTDDDNDGLDDDAEFGEYVYPAGIPGIGGTTVNVITDALLSDTDRDGRSDGDERASPATDAQNPDTDLDGILDGADCAPTDSLSPKPNPCAAGFESVKSTPGLQGSGSVSAPLTPAQTSGLAAFVHQRGARRTQKISQLRSGSESGAAKAVGSSATGSNGRGLGFQGPASIGNGFASVQSDKFTGAFSYDIPIKVPPGRAGMQPNLSLVYRSSNSHSWLGQGWDLNPGRIERSTKNGVPKYENPSDPFAPHDNNPSTPLDNPDIYVYSTSAGGSELVYTGNETIGGKSCGIYFSAVDGGELVKFVHVPDLTAYGKGYWEAWHKDGRKLVFGANLNSTSRLDHPTSAAATFMWNLDQETDVSGNKITYHYALPGADRALRLSSVQYNYLGATPKAVIDFGVMQRATNDPKYSYRESLRSGFRIVSDTFLTSILVSVPDRSGVYTGRGTRVRRYVLDYHPLDVERGRTVSCLKSVQEFGETDADSPFPAISLSYSERTPGWIDADTKWSMPASGTYQTDFYYIDDRGSSYLHYFSGSSLVDVDGDALPDIFTATVTNGDVCSTYRRYTLLNSGTRFASTESPLTAPSGFYLRNACDPVLQGSLLSDFDGDSRVDLLKAGYYDSNAGSVFGAWRNSGIGWDSTTNYTFPAVMKGIAAYNGPGWPTRTEAVDLDGNGLPDLVQSWQPIAPEPAVHRYFRNSADGFQPATSPMTEWMAKHTANRYEDNGIRFADLNGDGLPDLIQMLHNTGAVAIRRTALNDGATGLGILGTSAYCPPVIDPHFCFSNEAQLEEMYRHDTGLTILDLNGDDLPDLLQSWFREGAYVRRQYLNTGNGWDLPEKGWKTTSLYQLPNNLVLAHVMNPSRFSRGVQMADVNGDGFADVIQAQTSCHTCPAERQQLVTTGTKPNLLTRVDNGLGGTVQVEYSPQTKPHMKLYDPDLGLRDSDSFDPESGLESTNRMPSVTWVASKITRSALRPKNVDPAVPSTTGATTESYTTLYRYSGGRYLDREFRGFGKVKEIDAQTGNFTLTEFWQDYALKGRPKSERSYVGHRDDYRSGGVLRTPADETTPSLQQPKLVSETHHRYNVLIHPDDGDRLKSYTKTSSDVPKGMTLVTPACALTRTFEFGRAYGQAQEAAPSVLTATESYHDTRGNQVQSIAYGIVDLNNLATTTSADLAQPRLGVTFLNDSAVAADGRVIRFTEFLPVSAPRNTLLSWMDLPALTNVQGFDVQGDAAGTRSTTTTVLQASRMEYDALNRPKKTYALISGATDAVTEVAYDGFGNVNHAWDANRNLTTTTYDGHSATFPQIVTKVNPEGISLTETYIHDPGHGNLLVHTDANSRTRTATYDGLGRLLAKFDSSGNKLSEHQYNFWSESGGAYLPNRVRTISYAPLDGSSTSMVVSAWSEIHQDGLARTYQTFKVGQRGASDPIRTVTEFNDRGEGWRVSHPHWLSERGAGDANVRWSFSFSENDDLTIPASGTTKAWAKVGLNRPRESHRQLNASQTAVTGISYVDPLTKESVDGRGNLRRSRQDGFGNTIEIVEPTQQGTLAGGRSTFRGYDALGRLRYVRRQLVAESGNPLVPNPANPVTRIEYDALGRRTKLEDPDRGTSIYQYDAAGNLLRSTDSRGVVVARSYDALNRATRVIYPDLATSAPRVHTYEYDVGTGAQLRGRLARSSSPEASTAYSYDLEGRTSDVRRTIRGVEYVTSTVYDFAGREISKTYPAQAGPFTLQYAYDPITLQLDQIAESNSSRVFLADQQMSQFGGAASFTLGNGVKRTNTFDYVGRTTNLLSEMGDGTDLSSLNYQFDLNSNVSRLTESADPPEIAGAQVLGDMRYRYDHLDRLTAGWGRTMSGQDRGNPNDSLGYVNTSVPVFRYEYDTLGRMTSNSRFTDVGSTGTVQYEYATDPFAAGPYHAPTRIWKSGAIAHAFSYDSTGNLLTSTNGSTALARNDLARTARWDALGRMSSIVAKGQQTAFLYDADNSRIYKDGVNEDVTYVGDLIEKQDGGTNPGYTRHVFAGAMRIATLKPTGQINFILGDHLNSTVLVTDATTVVQRMDYEPYGARIEDPQRSKNPASLRHTYTGQQYDGESGLMFYNARYFDPIVGSFTAADPMVPNPSNPQSFNRYSYCDNNPIVHTDPSGHFSLRKFLGSNAGRATVIGLSAVAGAFFGPAGSAAVSQSANLYANKGNLNRSYFGGNMLQAGMASGNYIAMAGGLAMMGGNRQDHVRSMRNAYIQNAIAGASSYIGQELGGTVEAQMVAGAFHGAASSVAANKGSFNGAGREAMWGAGSAVACWGASKGVESVQSATGGMTWEEFKEWNQNRVNEEKQAIDAAFDRGDLRGLYASTEVNDAALMTGAGLLGGLASCGGAVVVPNKPAKLALGAICIGFWSGVSKANDRPASTGANEFNSSKYPNK